MAFWRMKPLQHLSLAVNNNKLALKVIGKRSNNKQCT